MMENCQVLYRGYLTKSPPLEGEKKGLTKFIKKRWRNRYFCLYKPNQNTNPPVFYFEYFTDEKCTKRKGHVDLNNCSHLIANAEVGTWRNVFSLKTLDRNHERVYYFSADSFAMMEEWVDKLCIAMGMVPDEQEVIKEEHVLPQPCNSTLQDFGSRKRSILSSHTSSYDHTHGRAAASHTSSYDHNLGRGASPFTSSYDHNLGRGTSPFTSSYDHSHGRGASPFTSSYDHNLGRGASSPFTSSYDHSQGRIAALLSPVPPLPPRTRRPGETEDTGFYDPEGVYVPPNDRDSDSVYKMPEQTDTDEKRHSYVNLSGTLLEAVESGAFGPKQKPRTAQLPDLQRECDRIHQSPLDDSRQSGVYADPKNPDDVYKYPAEDVYKFPTEDVYKFPTEDAYKFPTEDAYKFPTEDVYKMPKTSVGEESLEEESFTTANNSMEAAPDPEPTQTPQCVGRNGNSLNTSGMKKSGDYEGVWEACGYSTASRQSEVPAAKVRSTRAEQLRESKHTSSIDLSKAKIYRRSTFVASTVEDPLNKSPRSQQCPLEEMQLPKREVPRGASQDSSSGESTTGSGSRDVSESSDNRLYDEASPMDRSSGDSALGDSQKASTGDICGHFAKAEISESVSSQPKVLPKPSPRCLPQTHSELNYVELDIASPPTSSASSNSIQRTQRLTEYADINIVGTNALADMNARTEKK